MTDAVSRVDRSLKIGGVALMAVVVVAALFFGGAPPKLFGISAGFILFGITLLGVALLHHRTFEVGVTGLVFILALKLLTDPGFERIPTREERPELAVERVARVHCLRVRVLRATGGGRLDSSVTAQVTAAGDLIERFDVRDPAFSPLRSV